MEQPMIPAIAKEASQGGSDCIITRNVRDFGKSEIPALTPTEYLARM